MSTHEPSTASVPAGQLPQFPAASRVWSGGQAHSGRSQFACSVQSVGGSTMTMSIPMQVVPSLIAVACELATRRMSAV